MKIIERKFQHQLGITIIRMYSDKTATFRRKRYKNFASAKRAAERYYGFIFEVK